MFKSTFFSIAVFLLFFPAADAAPAFDVKLSSTTIHTAETTILLIEASWPTSEGPYSFGIRNPPLENLRIYNQSQSQETFLQNGEEWTRKTFKFELSPLTPGTGKIKDFFIPYLNASIGETAPSQFQVEPMTLKITKQPLSSRISPEMRKIGSALGAALIVILAAIASFSRRKKTGTAEPADPLEASRVQALQQLQRPNASAHELNTVFREFLERYYSLPTKLSVSEMEPFNLPSDEARTVKRLIENLTEAKYTGNMEGLNQIRKEIVLFIESKRVVGSPA